MTRLDTIKRIGFPEEECPKCHADSDDCSLCNGTGRFQQKVCKNWEPPVLEEGQRLVAYLDFDEWGGYWVEDSDGEIVQELNFPFATDFATPRHFETLGFKVEQ